MSNTKTIWTYLQDKPNDDDKPKLSKKKMKKLNRLSVAELKQLVIRPDVVEMHDVTAHDPKLLVLLKVNSREHAALWGHVLENFILC